MCQREFGYQRPYKAPGWVLSICEQAFNFDDAMETRDLGLTGECLEIRDSGRDRAGGRPVREALEGSYTQNTSREAFRVAHDISSYSFTALARGAAPLMMISCC